MFEYHKFTEEEKFSRYSSFCRHLGLERTLNPSVNDSYVTGLEETIKETGHMESQAWAEGWERGISYTSGRIVYNFVRQTKPRKLLETGVAKGVSTSYILSALHANEAGFLLSVDTNYKAGFLVNDELKYRWALLHGKSKDILPKLVCGDLDVFLHDSDHAYDNMMFEYTWAYPRLKVGGVLLSHDINRNNAIFDFVELVDEKLLFMPSSQKGYVIGVIIKTHDVKPSELQTDVEDVDAWFSKEAEINENPLH